MSRGADLRAGARWRVVWLEFIVAHRSFPLIFNRVERGWRDATGGIYSLQIVRMLELRERRSTFSRDQLQARALRWK